jgi:hypothetical protein
MDNRIINYPVRFVYVDGISSWYGAGVAAGMGVPGFCPDNLYNYIALAFWMSSGAADAAMIWSNPLVYFGSGSQFGTTND